MNPHFVEQALAGLSLGPLRFFETIDSTNLEALRWIEADAPDRALVLAEARTAGRGRLGRRWHTAPGTALAFSLILRQAQPHASLSRRSLPRLSGLGSVAVCQTLRQTYGLPAEIKWPNDVLVGGGKVCGVLAEAQWSGDQFSAAVIGIGVNITPQALPPDEQLAYPAACVETLLGQVVDRPKILRDILSKLLYWLDRLDRPEFLDAWQADLAFQDQWVQVWHPALQSDLDPQPVIEGRLVGLDEIGRLRLRDAFGKLLVIESGDLTLRPLK